ncbi:MAG: DEAD/DEAH box helicase, partial [Planctomycetota bacterium]|nr:DEAD/DEAH box helicase [Planctomycetota bacterium]
MTDEQRGLTSVLESRGLSVAALAQRLKDTHPWDECLGSWHTQEPRQAELCAFPAGVDQRLVELLAARGVQQVFSHQAEAIAASLAGRDVLVATPTASGKTLCY